MDDRGNVYIVDDEAIIRRSLVLLLSNAGYSCHPFTCGQDLIEALGYLKPGCVLLDVNMPDLDGLQVQDRLIDRRPDLPIIFMTAMASVPMAVRVIKKGAVDFIEKPFSDEALLERVETAHAALSDLLQASSRSNEAKALFDTLTSRETEVMRSLLRGDGNKIVAHKLNLSPRTVEMHRASIMKKIGVHNFTAAVQLALEAGLSPGP